MSIHSCDDRSSPQRDRLRDYFFAFVFDLVAFSSAGFSSLAGATFSLNNLPAENAGTVVAGIL
ncbi:MAG TPA: hypothetical protein V6C98_15435, partial [Thermosynechococcaceae cyanobacterium]